VHPAVQAEALERGALRTQAALDLVSRLIAVSSGEPNDSSPTTVAFWQQRERHRNALEIVHWTSTIAKRPWAVAVPDLVPSFFFRLAHQSARADQATRQSHANLDRGLGLGPHRASISVAPTQRMSTIPRPPVAAATRIVWEDTATVFLFQPWENPAAVFLLAIIVKSRSVIRSHLLITHSDTLWSTPHSSSIHCEDGGLCDSGESHSSFVSFEASSLSRIL